MGPATNIQKPIVSYELFKLSERGEQETMSAEEIIESFKAQTGISVIRASKEGVLKDYNLEADFPEVLGAMLATVYGASVTAITDFSEGEEPVVKIESGDLNVMVVSSGDDIVAVFIPSGATLSESDLKTLAKQLEESGY